MSDALISAKTIIRLARDGGDEARPARSPAPVQFNDAVTEKYGYASPDFDPGEFCRLRRENMIAEGTRPERAEALALYETGIQIRLHAELLEMREGARRGREDLRSANEDRLSGAAEPACEAGANREVCTEPAGAPRLEVSYG